MTMRTSDKHDQCGSCGAQILSLDDAYEHMMDPDCDDATQYPSWPDSAGIGSISSSTVWAWDCRTASGKGYALTGACGEDAEFEPVILVDDGKGGRIDRDETRSCKSPRAFRSTPLDK